MNNFKVSEISLLGTFIAISVILGGVVLRTRQLNSQGQISQREFIERQEDVLRRPQGGTRRKQNRSRKKY